MQTANDFTLLNEDPESLAKYDEKIRKASTFDYTIGGFNKKTGLTQYEIRNELGELHLRGHHKGNQKETDAFVYEQTARLNDPNSMKYTNWAK